MNWRERGIDFLYGLLFCIALPVFSAFVIIARLSGKKVGKGGAVLLLLPFWCLAAMLVWVFIREPNARPALIAWLVLAVVVVALMAATPWLIGQCIRFKNWLWRRR